MFVLKTYTRVGNIFCLITHGVKIYINVIYNIMNLEIVTINTVNYFSILLLLNIITNIV